MKQLFAALFCFALCTAPSLADDGGKPKRSPVEATCNDGGQKVQPGNSHTNTAGVKLTNAVNSGGNGTLTPKGGKTTCESTAQTKTGFKGGISGLKTGDTANLASSNTVVVTGSGGSVNISGGSTVTVTVTGNGYVNVNANGVTVAQFGPSTATYST